LQKSTFHGFLLLAENCEGGRESDKKKKKKVYLKIGELEERIAPGHRTQLE